MKNYKVSSPTRVDLAGGTLDLWPLYLFVGSATTINLAIDIFTHVEIVDRDDSRVLLESVDLGKKWDFESLDQLGQSSDEKMNLFRCVIEFVKPRPGFHLRAVSESPIGGGIGGSSSLVVSLLKAFQLRSDLRAMNPVEMAQIAHNIEAQILNTPTGTQDYLPAISGGLNLITYRIDKISQVVLPIKDSQLQKHFMLVYTGVPHHSGLNNFQVLERAVRKDPITIQALHDLKLVSEDLLAICHRGEWDKIPDIFHRELKARVALAPSFSSPAIDKLKEVAFAAGATALKICGAGGGGCVLLWVPPESREKVKLACEKEGLRILVANPVDPLS